MKSRKPIFIFLVMICCLPSLVAQNDTKEFVNKRAEHALYIIGVLYSNMNGWNRPLDVSYDEDGFIYEQAFTNNPLDLPCMKLQVKINSVSDIKVYQENYYRYTFYWEKDKAQIRWFSRDDTSVYNDSKVYTVAYDDDLRIKCIRTKEKGVKGHKYEEDYYETAEIEYNSRGEMISILTKKEALENSMQKVSNAFEKKVWSIIPKGYRIDFYNKANQEQNSSTGVLSSWSKNEKTGDNEFIITYNGGTTILYRMNDRGQITYRKYDSSSGFISENSYDFDSKGKLTREEAIDYQKGILLKHEVVEYDEVNNKWIQIFNDRKELIEESKNGLSRKNENGVWSNWR